MDSSRLTRLEIGDAWIDAAALDHISTLPFLQYLQFALGSDFLDYMQTCKGPFRAAQSGTPIFSALTSLVLMMGIPDADPLVGFLEIVFPAKLLEFTFIFAEQPGEIAQWCQPSATDLSKLFSALLKFESLQYLKCKPRASLDFLQDPFDDVFETPDLVVDDESFRPLLKLRDIRYCRLDLIPQNFPWVSSRNLSNRGSIRSDSSSSRVVCGRRVKKYSRAIGS